jgi:hypothetical protein
VLRCTISGLIPLMMSSQYSGHTESFYRDNTKLFTDIIKHESYYVLRKLPVSVAERLLVPVLLSLLSGQKNNGMWKVRDTERITFDILSALKHTNLLDRLISERSLKYNPLDYVKYKYDFYSLLIKSGIYQKTDDNDKSEIAAFIAEIQNTQQDNGSWDNTVVGTVVNIENLLDLGIEKEDVYIQRGIKYLFSNLNNKFEGIHTINPYGLVAENIFSSSDRIKEFESADKLKPEWIPRKLCFRTMAIIPDTVCLTLFVRMSMEDDKRVQLALDNIYKLYTEYGGLCATNIKQPFL